MALSIVSWKISLWVGCYCLSFGGVPRQSLRADRQILIPPPVTACGSLELGFVPRLGLLHKNLFYHQYAEVGF